MGTLGLTSAGTNWISPLLIHQEKGQGREGCSGASGVTVRTRARAFCPEAHPVCSLSHPPRCTLHARHGPPAPQPALLGVPALSVFGRGPRPPPLMLSTLQLSPTSPSALLDCTGG